jgi:hypothetical protein
MDKLASTDSDDSWKRNSGPQAGGDGSFLGSHMQSLTDIGETQRQRSMGREKRKIRVRSAA